MAAKKKAVKAEAATEDDAAPAAVAASVTRVSRLVEDVPVEARPRDEGVKLSRARLRHMNQLPDGYSDAERPGPAAPTPTGVAIAAHAKETNARLKAAKSEAVPE